MEIINTAEVTARDWLISILQGGMLSESIGPYPTICFLLTRSMETPGLFDELINNISTIDSTTRHHIAFVGFQSATTFSYLSPERVRRPGATVELRISGMRTTASMRHQTKIRLKEMMQYWPNPLIRRTFDAEMTSATDALLDIWRFQEDSLPALVFVNALRPLQTVFCPIDAAKPLQDIYERIFRPLSTVLRHYERIAKAAGEMKLARDTLARYEEMDRRLKTLKEELTQIAASLEALGAEADEDTFERDRRDQAGEILLEYLTSAEVRNSYTQRQRKVIEKRLEVDPTEVIDPKVAVAGMSHRLQSHLLNFRGQSGSWRSIQAKRLDLNAKRQRAERLEAQIRATSARRSDAAALVAAASSNEEHEWNEVMTTGMGPYLERFRYGSKAAPFALVAGWINDHAKNAPKAKLSQPTVQNFFYGDVGNFSQNGEHVIQRFSKSDSNSLSRLATLLTVHLDELKLDNLNAREARLQIASLKRELAREVGPDTGIVRAATGTLWNITQGAIGSLVAAAVQPSVWSWVEETLKAWNH